MRKRLVLVSTILLVGCVQDGIANDASTLAFSFPDGVEGGIGRIQGTGDAPVDPTSDWTLDQIKKCGLRDAHYPEINVSHRYTIVGASTPRDQDVVRCVKGSVPWHFSVFDKNGEERFRDFWSTGDDKR